MRITDTMQSFVAGESTQFIDDCADRLQNQWYQFSPGTLAPTFLLVWSAFAPRWTESTDSLLTRLIGEGSAIESTRLERWKAAVGTGGKVNRSFRSSILIECELDEIDLGGSNFSGCWLESTSFTGCNLNQADFTGTSILDVDFSGAQFSGANFTGTDVSISIKVDGSEFVGPRALGFLRFHGAATPPVEDIHVAMANPSYEIARKIARELLKAGPSQHLGLTQRGVAARAPELAESFVDLLVSLGYAHLDRSGSAKTVEVTRPGRGPLMQLADETRLDAALAGYLLPKGTPA